MQVAIIGASHGGIHAALTLKKLSPKTEVYLIEKKSEVSFISNGIVLLMTQQIDELDQARYTTIEDLKENGIHVYSESEVLEICNEEKKIIYQDNVGNKFKLDYDKLIVATGSNQFHTNITFPDNDRVMVFKDYPSSIKVLEKISNSSVISIIGGGYIGVELCDALNDIGKEIHLIESADSVLFRYLDKEIAGLIEQKIKKSGVILHLNENVISFEDTNEDMFITKTTKQEIENDFAIVAVNARPESKLVKDFLEVNSNGTIRVNDYMQTSDPDIYALGDVVSYPRQTSYQHSFIPLVNNVTRSATVAAMNVLGHHYLAYGTTQKTTATYIFGSYIASTGLTEVEAKFEGIDTESIFLTLPYQFPYLKKQDEVHIKLVFAKGTHKIIGGQLMSEKDITQSVNTLSLAIEKETTLDELVTMDFYFNPMINQPMGLISRAAYEFLIEKYKD
ncbi:FAD-dependent oxidoreductase [Enterococcus sp. LJL99]